MMDSRSGFRASAIGLRVSAAGFGLLVACQSLPASAPDSPSVMPTPAAMVSFRTQVSPVLGRSCFACHVSGRELPEFIRADGSADLTRVRSILTRIVSQIESGRMPRGSVAKVSTPELALLKAWQGAGAPDN